MNDDFVEFIMYDLAESKMVEEFVFELMEDKGFIYGGDEAKRVHKEAVKRLIRR